jgi:hypothetical protein
LPSYTGSTLCSGGRYGFGPAFPDAHRDPALRRYLEQRAEKDHMAALIQVLIRESADCDD